MFSLREILFALFNKQNSDIFSGIKKYVVGLIIKTSSDPANMEVSSCNLLHFKLSCDVNECDADVIVLC